MGRTFRRNSGFRPKGRGFKDLKKSRKFREQDYYDRHGKFNKPPIEEVPPLEEAPLEDIV